MLKHLVLFKLHTQHQSRGPELVDKLNKLNGIIPSLISLHAGIDVLHSPASWDLGLIAEFEDLDALEAYRIHPEHQKVVALVQEICSDRAVLDF
jgi:hypothetical protein